MLWLVALIALPVSPCADLIEGRGDRDNLRPRCVLEAAKASTLSPLQVDAMWQLYEADALDTRRSLVTFSSSPVLVARFRKQLESQHDLPVRGLDARLLMAIDEPWTLAELERRANAVSTKLAYAVVRALVDDELNERVAPLRRIALWRTAKEPAFEWRRSALDGLARLTALSDAETTEVLALARADAAAREHLAPLLMDMAERLPEARTTALEALLSVSAEETDLTLGTRIASGPPQRASSIAWKAAVEQPRTVCWLPEPLRQWLRTCDLHNPHHLEVLEHVGTWVRTHWGRDALSNTRLEPHWLTSEERVRTIVLDDGSELNLRLGPTLPLSSSRRGDDALENLAVVRGEFHSELSSLLSRPPYMKCEPVSAGPRDHAQPLAPASALPVLEVRTGYDADVPTLEVRGADGRTIVWSRGIEHVRQHPDRPEPAWMRMMPSWQPRPVTVQRWWRGPGRYELVVHGLEETGITPFEVPADAGLVRMEVNALHGRDTTLSIFRRARPGVTVGVDEGAVTITNLTRDTLVADGGNWSNAMDIEQLNSGLSLAGQPPWPELTDPAILPGQRHTFELALRPPNTGYRLRIRYLVEGLEGRRFVTPPATLASQP